jgi:hypothetical protein
MTCQRLIDATGLLIVSCTCALLGCSSTESADTTSAEQPDGAADVSLPGTDGGDANSLSPDADGSAPPKDGSGGGDALIDGGDGSNDVAPEASGPTMNFYFGNFHAHTSFSEGVGPPTENLLWARDVAGFDFFAITDHAEQLNASEWNDTATQADAVTEDGVFVALRGFEWSNPLIGHSVVLDTTDRTSTITSPILSMFYDWVDSAQGLAQFNHPGREADVFGNLAFDAKLSDNFFAIEVGNKDDGITQGEYLPYYAKALDLGWRLAPTANQDCHTQQANSHRSVFVGLALTRAALLEAMKERRIYASEDPNMKVTFKLGDAWMGTRVSGAPPASFTIRVSDDEPIVSLDLVSNGGTVVNTLTPPAGSMDVVWEPAVPSGTGKWYYLLVTATDVNDGEPPVQKAVTAPIWIDP